MKWLPGRLLFAIAMMVMIAMATDAALHSSHVMVFFSMLMLGALFLTLYEESDKHKLGVSVACLVLGSIYVALYPLDFTWWRFTFYSATLYVLAILFFANWIKTKHHHKGKHHHHRTVKRPLLVEPG